MMIMMMTHETDEMHQRGLSAASCILHLEDDRMLIVSCKHHRISARISVYSVCVS